MIQVSLSVYLGYSLGFVWWIYFLGFWCSRVFPWLLLWSSSCFSLSKCDLSGLCVFSCAACFTKWLRLALCDEPIEVAASQSFHLRPETPSFWNVVFGVLCDGQSLYWIPYYMPQETMQSTWESWYRDCAAHLRVMVQRLCIALESHGTEIMQRTWELWYRDYAEHFESHGTETVQCTRESYRENINSFSAFSYLRLSCEYHFSLFWLQYLLLGGCTKQYFSYFRNRPRHPFDCFYVNSVFQVLTVWVVQCFFVNKLLILL